MLCQSLSGYMPTTEMKGRTSFVYYDYFISKVVMSNNSFWKCHTVVLICFSLIFTRKLRLSCKLYISFLQMFRMFNNYISNCINDGFLSCGDEFINSFVQNDKNTKKFERCIQSMGWITNSIPSLTIQWPTAFIILW